MNVSSRSARRLLRTLLVAAALPACAAQKSAPTLQRFEYEAGKMATTFRLVFFATSRAEADAASKAAFERIDLLDANLSDFRADSEISGLKRIAAAGPTGQVAISDDLRKILRVAQRVAEDSDGAFDVTIAPVVELWRRAQRREVLPSASEIEAARMHVGFRKLVFDDERGGVRFTEGGVQLDLGGIAKGYAADATLALLAARGIPRALVAAGGDVAVSDPPPGETGWRVELAEFEDDPAFERPLGAPQTPPRTVLSLAHAAVSTSGDRWKFVEIGGVRYSHVVDPSTGMGLTRRVLATVVAPDGTTADALTKVASVFEPERALAFVAQRPGVEARIVTLQDGVPHACASPGLARMIVDPAPAVVPAK
jgi:thiamine biosynthesis lipoprotein